MSSYYIDLKYTRILGSRLANFRQRKADLFTFSHTCEENRHGKLKERGYFYRQKESMMVKCHHCGMSHRLGTFIGLVDPTLANEYKMETYKERVASGTILQKPKPSPKPVIKQEPVDSVLDGLTSLYQLGDKHPAYKYAVKRAIPKEHFKEIFFAPKFFSFAKKYKDSFTKISKDYPRLVFPYFDANGRVYAFTARAFGKEEPKYIFVGIDEDATRIYGLNRIDSTKTVIAVEGQIDSLCIDNCIAVGGADYSSHILKSLQSNLVVVPDNDFVRNRQVADSVNKAIELGFAVSLFPESFKHKDINDAVKAGMDKTELRQMILNNAKSGAEAKLELIFRRKC